MEVGLLLRPTPGDDLRGILNITAIDRKLHLTMVIEEHFEFALCAARTVKISAAGSFAIHLP